MADERFDAETGAPSGGGRGWFTACAIGCVVILLLCGGCAGLIAVLAPQLVQKLEELAEQISESVSDDPQVVREVTDEIAGIDIPEEFVPKSSLRFNIEGMRDKPPRWVVYEIEDGDGVLVMGDFGPIDVDTDSIVQQIDIALVQSDRERDDIEITSRETREFNIRGAPATFEFAKGVDRDNDREYIRVVGSFEGLNGPVLFFVLVEADDFTEEQLVRVIESIQ